MTRPYCPATNQLCADHADYECHRRWAARPLPRGVATEACPGFLRSPHKAQVIHVAELTLGRADVPYSEAIRELSMAGRLDEIMGVPA